MSRSDGAVRRGRAIERDRVDTILEAWQEQRPDLDLSAMGVIARISRASRILERLIEAVLADFGINEPGFGVLAALLRAGPPHKLTPTELFSSLLISSGAMTNRLDRLTEAGLVSREPDPNDRRSMLVALTPEGLALINEAVTAHTENELQLLAPFTTEERAEFAALLRKLLVTVADLPEPEEEGAPRAGAAT